LGKYLGLTALGVFAALRTLLKLSLEGPRLRGLPRKSAPAKKVTKTKRCKGVKGKASTRKKGTKKGAA